MRDELREQIARAEFKRRVERDLVQFGAAIRPIEDWNDLQEETREELRRGADTALALVADALLSDAAVEATVQQFHQMPLVTVDSRHAQDRMNAKRYIAAALAAAGVTPEHDDAE